MVDDGTTGAHHPPVPSGAPREPLTGAPPPPAAASGPDGLPTAWATPLWRPGGLVPTRDVGAVPELLAERLDDPSRPRALLAAANGYRVGAEPDLAAARYHQCIDEGLAQGRREFAAMAHGGLGLGLR